VSGFWYKIPEKTFSVKFTEVTFPAIDCTGGQILITKSYGGTRRIDVS